MGQGGMTYGLALYPDLDWLLRIWSGEVSDEENEFGTVATAVTFGTRQAMDKADLKAIKQHGWKIAGTRAYPQVYHKSEGMAMRSPTAAELRWLDASMQTVVEFIQRRPQEDLEPLELSVPLPDGLLSLTLAWVDV
jgi:hypothetical protein